MAFTEADFYFPAISHPEITSTSRVETNVFITLGIDAQGKWPGSGFG